MDGVFSVVGSDVAAHLLEASGLLDLSLVIACRWVPSPSMTAVSGVRHILFASYFARVSSSVLH